MRKLLSFLVICTLVILYIPARGSAASGQGKVVGNIFAADGTTPLEGAVVKVKNVSTGTVYESRLTDSHGFFSISKMGKGVYAIGVSTPNGDFECESMVGIEPNKTSRISVSIAPYEEKVASAVKAVYSSRNRDGEALVARVISFDHGSHVAEFYIFKGFLQSIDRIHVFGPSSDYYQKVHKMTMEKTPVERVYAGQTGFMEMEYDVIPGDLIFVVCEKGFSPFFLTPIGIATIVAGSAAIIYGVKELVKDPDEVSTFRKRFD